jgi:flagellar hook protein FlgE
MDSAGRRISGITFEQDGSFGGMGGTTPDTAAFQIIFNQQGTGAQDIQLNLGTIGGFDGLSQFGGTSTVAANGQDGYAAGYLSGLSVSSEGVLSSANSGDPVATRALSGGAGSVNGGSLEKSNVDMASEFVNLIQAQNGYQANARTIKVANDMLRELSNLIQ